MDQRLLQTLEGKRKLEVGDASKLLHFLQEQTSCILSPTNAGQKHPPGTRTASRPSDVKRSLDPGSTGPINRGRSLMREEFSLMSPNSPFCGQSHKRDTPSSYNLTSVDDFPPMATAVTSSSRKKGRQGRAPRRITPTPVKAPVVASTAERWNPAFTCDVSSSDGPLPLSEERRLLLEERRHWQNQSNRMPPKFSGNSKRKHFSSHAMPRTGTAPGSHNGTTSSSESPMSSHGGSNPWRQLSPQSLDSQISSHSIFTLNQSVQHGQPKGFSLEQNLVCLQSDSSDLKLTNMQPVTAATTTLSTPQRTDSVLAISPLTSTPRTDSLPAQHVSLGNVLYARELEALAEMYARIIEERLVPNITSEVYFVIQLLLANFTGTSASQLICESQRLFASLENCVYFAVCVLGRIRRLIAALDKPTLRLLAENIRIAEFRPELSAYFAEACERTVNSSNLSHPVPEAMYAGVPFQASTDNSRNFSSVKAFHTFKKQRDLFYSVLREWEKNHNEHKWSMQEALREKIRTLVCQSSDICSLAHLAQLFRKQLMMSCSSDLTATDTTNSLVGNLKRVNPDKFLRLRERFLQPSIRGMPCPPPAFSPREEFFVGFIQLADSYPFNYHLKMSLYAELMVLHASCASIQHRDVSKVLQPMRVLAKFMGFLEFLPYKHPVPENLLTARNAMGHVDLSPCVSEAEERGHLCVTVPWVVQYLAMMDAQAHAVNQLSSTLRSLAVLYRSLRLEDGEGDRISREVFLVLISLGWLFELPNVSAAPFIGDTLEMESHLPAQKPSPETLDFQDSISAALLYSCCPYLGEIRSLLAEFAAGLQSEPRPMRKIKPVPADTSKLEDGIGPERQLQLRLQEHFFRSHPPFLKQLCDIIAERVGAAAVGHCEAYILPGHVLQGNMALAQWMKEKCSAAEVGADETDVVNQAEIDRKLRQVSEVVIVSATEEALMYISSYCQSQCLKALELLLDEVTAEQVVATAGSIAASVAIDTGTKWAGEKLRGAVFNELSRAFDKQRRAVRAALKGPVMSGSPLPGVHDECYSNDTSQVPPTSAIEDYKVVVGAVVTRGCLSGNEQIVCMEAALEGLTVYLEKVCFVLPGVALPQLMPKDTDAVLRLSVDLASILLSHGLLVSCDGKVSNQEGIPMKKYFALWKVTRKLKLEFPTERLLSRDAFKRYLEQERRLGQSVWRSLADVLVGCLHRRIMSSPVVEAVWLCRRQQLDCAAEGQHLLEAAAVFLDVWYSGTGMDGLPEAHIDGVHAGPASELREVHFVRLLTVVLQEHKCVPPSVSSHAHLRTVVYPFDS